jgi:hypothetical protein
MLVLKSMSNGTLWPALEYSLGMIAEVLCTWRSHDVWMDCLPLFTSTQHRGGRLRSFHVTPWDFSHPETTLRDGDGNFGMGVGRELKLIVWRQRDEALAIIFVGSGV